MKRVALVLCLAAALAACGGSVQSNPTSLPPIVPTPSIAATGEASLGPALTPSTSMIRSVSKPPEADAPTSEGAAAFVRYYVAVINQALLTNDSRVLSTLSDPGCGGCKNYINSITETASEHAHLESRGLSVSEAVAPAVEAGETVVLLNFDADGFVARTADGVEVARGAPAKGLVAELRVLQRNGVWIVMGFRLASGER